jgi:hypothetical protein
MSNELYVGSCPICGQGRQIVYCTVEGSRYFLGCEDCEQEWSTPTELSVSASQPMGTFGRARLATREEMREHPWSTHIKNLQEI